METFVEIINTAKVRSNTNLELSGIFANKKEWEKRSFYPKVGVVGVIIAEAQSCEGKILIIHCGDRLIVPILPGVPLFLALHTASFVAPIISANSDAQLEVQFK